MIEPVHEKTNNFRPGPTQTGLYNHGDGQWLEILDLERTLYYPCSENKGADQLRSCSAPMFLPKYANCSFSHAKDQFEFFHPPRFSISSVRKETIPGCP